MTTRSGWLLALTICSASCSGSMQYKHPEVEERLPDALRDDYRMFTENCSKCHDLARPLQAHVTDVAHWDRYVARMMRTSGSGISPKEAPAILRFLHWYTQEVVNAKTTGDQTQTYQPPATAPTPQMSQDIPSQPESQSSVGTQQDTMSYPSATEDQQTPAADPQGEATP